MADGWLILRSGMPRAADVAFIWEAVTNATSYVLQVGTTPLATDTFNTNVGAVRSYTLTLPIGKYWARVVPYVGGTAGTATSDQEVAV